MPSKSSSSQTSPMPSPSSVSSWPGLATKEQLSSLSRTPSSSSSVSQASPRPSPSVSFWTRLKMFGQLSLASATESSSLSGSVVSGDPSQSESARSGQVALMKSRGSGTTPIPTEAKAFLILQTSPRSKSQRGSSGGRRLQSKEGNWVAYACAKLTSRSRTSQNCVSGVTPSTRTS